jgi:hypothetical protein
LSSFLKAVKLLFSRFPTYSDAAAIRMVDSRVFVPLWSPQQTIAEGLPLGICKVLQRGTTMRDDFVYEGGRMRWAKACGEWLFA